MIIVEVEVPVLGKQYDFRIDADMALGVVCQELAGMICRKEQCVIQGDGSRFLLWDVVGGRQLHLDRTAADNDVRTGSRLMLL